MILHRVYSNRVWIERAEFSLKLHKILNLDTLSLKTSVKSDERFSKWRKFFLTKSFLFYIITYSLSIFYEVFPFSLRLSIFISYKQPRSTDVKEEKLSPHNTSITPSMLKFLEAFKRPVIFCNCRFHNHQPFCC